MIAAEALVPLSVARKVAISAQRSRLVLIMCLGVAYWRRKKDAVEKLIGLSMYGIAC
jgi:hypothetical protein